MAAWNSLSRVPTVCNFINRKARLIKATESCPGVVGKTITALSEVRSVSKRFYIYSQMRQQQPAKQSDVLFGREAGPAGRMRRRPMRLGILQAKVQSGSQAVQSERLLERKRSRHLRGQCRPRSPFMLLSSPGQEIRNRRDAACIVHARNCRNDA